MLAAIDSIITLLIFIGVAIVSALLNRRKERQQEDYSDLPPFPRQDRPAPGPTRARKTWEDELRELLEQAKPSGQTEAPPPIIYTPPPPPVPERPRRHIPEAATEHSTPAWDRRESEENILGRFKDSSERLGAAEQLHDRVMRQLQEASAHRAVPTAAARRGGPTSTSDAARLVRDPKNIRNAILAQVILGPPRALDEA